MTRVLLIYAGPTPWDAEGRLGGNSTLGLTSDALSSIGIMAAGLAEPVTAVYTWRENEACEQAAKIVAQRFGLRVRDNEQLASIELGLWQGLTREELRYRYPSVFETWEENPQAVTPPEGESLAEVTQRLRDALSRIIRRNRGGVIAITLRPLSLQVCAGLLRGEDLAVIASHLHNHATLENIELPDDRAPF